MGGGFEVSGGHLLHRRHRLGAALLLHPVVTSNDAYDIARMKAEIRDVVVTMLIEDLGVDPLKMHRIAGHPVDQVLQPEHEDRLIESAVSCRCTIERRNHFSAVSGVEDVAYQLRHTLRGRL